MIIGASVEDALDIVLPLVVPPRPPVIDAAVDEVVAED